MDRDELRRAQALAYCWGRNDEKKARGGPARGYSTDFANFYVAAKNDGRANTVQDGYQAWAQAGYPACG